MVSSSDAVRYLNEQELAEMIRAELGVVIDGAAMQQTTASAPVAYLTSKALVERIRVDYGVTIDQRTITSWCSRSDNPLKPTGPVMRGQTRRFDWPASRTWLEWELVRGGLRLEHIRGIADLETRLRMQNRWRRAHGLPPPIPEGTWAPEFHP